MTITVMDTHRGMKLGVATRSYPYFAVAKLYNRTVIIVSRLRFELAETGILTIADTRKVPMSRAVTRVYMGRPYREHEITTRTARYTLVDYRTMSPNQSMQLYEVMY